MSAPPTTLADEQLERLADLVADRLRAPVAPAGLVDAATVASELGVSREWVYRAADALGAVRLPSSPAAAKSRLPESQERGRLRFDLDRARAALATVGDPPADDSPSPAPPRPRARRRASTTAGSVLQVRPRSNERL